MNIPLVLIVLSSTLGAAFISAFTILIFFFPIETKKILGARIRGIVPRRMNEIMSATVKSGLEHIDFKNLVKKKFINNSAFELLLPEIDQHVDDFLRHRLVKKCPS